jgi:hypothetical protein
MEADRCVIWIMHSKIKGILLHVMSEDTKVVIRSRESKSDRQYNGQAIKRQNDKQRSTKHYIEIWRSSNTNPATNRGELRCSGRVNSSCSTCGIRHAILVIKPVIGHEWGNLFCRFKVHFFQPSIKESFIPTFYQIIFCSKMLSQTS